MPSDFRMELSSESISSIEKVLLATADTASNFTLGDGLRLTSDERTGVSISLPPNVDVRVWDRLKGAYKRTRSKSETRRITFFTPVFQVTIDRDNIAVIKYFENITTRTEISRQLIKV
ncbi:hypothetical protein HY312_00030 [Candidatus Saccharibacteria bacterium]|nr:hypothetical protein [Candidatus Saccharibacteria bacterium]